MNEGYNRKTLAAVGRDPRQDQITQSQREGRHIWMRLALVAPFRQNQHNHLHCTHGRPTHGVITEETGRHTATGLLQKAARSRFSSGPKENEAKSSARAAAPSFRKPASRDPSATDLAPPGTARPAAAAAFADGGGGGGLYPAYSACLTIVQSRKRPSVMGGTTNTTGRQQIQNGKSHTGLEMAKIAKNSIWRRTTHTRQKKTETYTRMDVLAPPTLPSRP